MTLQERLHQLEEDKLRVTAYSTPVISDKQKDSDLHAMRRSRQEMKNERPEHYHRLAAGGCSSQYLDQRKRAYLEQDLRWVGFKNCVFPGIDSIVTLLAEDQQSANGAWTKMTAILKVNPDANLSTYEEDLCVMIVRIDKPEQPQKLQTGFIDV